jgi:hypothetical protein
MGWIDPNHGKTGALKRQLLRFSRMPFDGVAETAADFTKRRNQNKKPDDFWLEWQDLNLGPLASRTRVVIEKTDIAITKVSYADGKLCDADYCNLYVR